MSNLIGISGKMGSGKDLVYEILNYLKQEGDWSSFSDYMRNAFFVHTAYENKKFASKIKDIVCLLIGCTREQLEDREFKEKELGEEWHKTLWHIRSNHNILKTFLSKEEAENGLYNWDDLYDHETYVASEFVAMTPRLMLQLLGTECGRQIIHPNIWVNALFADYEVNKSEWLSEINSKWIITDVRFPNEAQAIKDKGGIVIRVERPEYCDGCTLENIEVQDCKDCAVYQDDYSKQHPSETALDDYDGFDYVIENNGSIEDLVEKVKQLNLV